MDRVSKWLGKQRTKVAAVAATQAQEAVGQDAAFEEDVELVLHKLRQVRASGRLSLIARSYERA